MTSEHILIARDGPLATVTMNRPERRNALSVPLMRELTGNDRTLITISHDPDVVQLADTVYYLADGKLLRKSSLEPVALEVAAAPQATLDG